MAGIYGLAAKPLPAKPSGRTIGGSGMREGMMTGDEGGGLRVISQEEFERIVTDHQRKTQSRPGEYVRIMVANLDCTDLTEVRTTGQIILSEASIRSANLKGLDVSDWSLGNADLTGANLTFLKGSPLYLQGAVLTDANFSNALLDGVWAEKATFDGACFANATIKRFSGQASFRGSKLTGARMDNAQFASAILTGADLSGASLDGSYFEGADLDGAILDGANFANADLEKAKHLRADQLAGTDLTNAKLPPDVAKFEALKRAEETIKIARPLFLGLIAACLYSWVTIGQTTDAALLTRAIGKPLPLIGAEVPVVWFFLATPLILVALNVYLHFYLHALWQDLAGLPRRFPDGRPVTEKVHPWLLTNIALYHSTQLEPKRLGVVRMGARFSKAMVWGLVPITILFFALRAMPLGDRLLNGWLLFMLFMSVSTGLWFAYLGARTLTRREPRFREMLWRIAQAAMPVISIISSYLSPAWHERISEQEAGVFAPLLSPIRHTLDLRFAELSTKRPDWKGDVRMVAGAPLRHARMDGADAYRAFLVGANLIEARLAHSTLAQADLREAILAGAHLENANLEGADLRGANLKGAFLNGADLRNANLEGALLIDAKVDGAHFWNARLAGACLDQVDLTAAKGLEAKQLASAYGDNGTHAPQPLAVKQGGCPAP
ncbi:MAG: pentapeptide repeat-containing protein [Rhodospirillaceae bacterium]|nr:pentapeptide repeat-containing protein [Rhodospirillales bacterium]